MRRHFLQTLLGCVTVACLAGSPAGSDFEQRRATHWAWQGAREQSPPDLGDASWARDPIDRFVLAKLHANGLEPAPAAEKRALIRRLNFALVGLPPTPEEVEAFVKDDSDG